jgi:hypothetical protein
MRIPVQQDVANSDFFSVDGTVATAHGRFSEVEVSCAGTDGTVQSTCTMTYSTVAPCRPYIGPRHSCDIIFHSIIFNKYKYIVLRVRVRLQVQYNVFAPGILVTWIHIYHIYA